MKPSVTCFEGALAPSSRAEINCGPTPAATIPAIPVLMKLRRE
jgi:hypothetical protein